MAIIVDYSGIKYASLFANMSYDQVPTEELVRHSTLNSLRRFRVQFSEEYGEMVLALDDKKSWRSEVFPYYKARRKARKADDKFDWDFLMGMMNKIQSELKTFFPYKVVTVPRAEGDDVVAVLSRKLPGRHVVISKDDDVAQLVSDTVEVFRPLKETFAPHSSEPRRDLQRHIMKGCTTDDIPNILSDSDTFVTEGKRQKSLRSTFIEEVVTGKKSLTLEQIENYRRNKTLISLDEIPTDIEQAIIDAYYDASENDRSKLYKYFVENKLKELLLRIEDF